MHELRRELDDWGLVKGLTGEEKDPEELLNLLLVHTFNTPSPIVLRYFLYLLCYIVDFTFNGSYMKRNRNRNRNGNTC